jgi:protein-S-isoprenylcysteine O-methyltransferase Ste14
MPLIKEVVLPATQKQRWVQNAAWVFIYAGLLLLLTGVAMGRMAAPSPADAWPTGSVLVVVGSLATALGVLLIYIRSRMH